ncbi:SLC13 family permease [Peptoniphilaceae bacterium SGI.137]
MNDKLGKKEFKKKWVYLILIFTGFFIARNFVPEGLDQAGWDGFLVLFLTVLMWITNAVPMAVTAVFALFFAGWTAFETQENILAAFSGTGVFFLLGAMIIGHVFTKVGLGKRISLYILPLLGSKASMVLLSIMLGTGIISMFLADIPTALIFYGISLPILKQNNCEPGHSNFGKAVMLGIPTAAALGGIGTPAGSGMNAITMQLIKTIANVEITFTQWTIIGAPIALLSLVVAWRILLKAYKPEIDVVDGLSSLKEDRKSQGKFTSDEWKFGIVFLTMVFFWFFPKLSGLSMYQISWFGIFILALLGMDLINWKEINGSLDWSAILICGTATALATVVANLGTGAWLSQILSDLFLGDIAKQGLIFLVLAINLMMMVGHYPMPQGVSLVGLALPVVLALATQMNINPLIVALPVSMSTSMLLLVPIDPTMYTTYSGGYWEIKDMMKIGVVITLAYVLINTIWMVGAVSIGIL